MGLLGSTQWPLSTALGGKLLVKQIHFSLRTGLSKSWKYALISFESTSSRLRAVWTSMQFEWVNWCIYLGDWVPTTPSLNLQINAFVLKLGLIRVSWRTSSRYVKTKSTIPQENKKKLVVKTFWNPRTETILWNWALMHSWLYSTWCLPVMAHPPWREWVEQIRRPGTDQWHFEVSLIVKKLSLDVVTCDDG